jgi:hypothetical protein
MASQGDGNEAQIQKADRDGIERRVNQKPTNYQRKHKSATLS